MSGIEAAGLALGIFPIILTALENYRETAEVVKDWWKFKRKYVKCKRDVEYYQIAFESNLKQLLLPLVCDDDEIGILMSNPGGAGWQNEDLDAKLRERLPNAYESYRDSINEINGVMRKLTQELGLDKDYLDARSQSKAVSNHQSSSWNVLPMLEYNLTCSCSGVLFDTVWSRHFNTRECCMTRQDL